MREWISKEIDGCLYEFEQLGTRQGLKISTKLLKLFGEPLVLAMGMIFKDVDFVKLKDQKLDHLLSLKIHPESLNKAVQVLMERMDENEVVEVIATLTSSELSKAGITVKCNGKGISNFDDHYAGRLNHLMKVLYAAIEAQFGNFLSAVFPSAQGLPTANK